MTDLVDAKLVDDEPAEAGEFSYFVKRDSNEIAGMVFCCPCGCGSVSGIDFTDGSKPRKHPAWDWDGNREAPTLSPSLNRTDGCKWHGFLQKGKFRRV